MTRHARCRSTARMRTVNKRITELTGLPYSELVGRKIYDLIDEPTQEEMERGLGRFLEKKRWAGTVTHPAEEQFAASLL